MYDVTRSGNKVIYTPIDPKIKEINSYANMLVNHHTMFDNCHEVHTFLSITGSNLFGTSKYGAPIAGYRSCSHRVRMTL